MFLLVRAVIAWYRTAREHDHLCKSTFSPPVTRGQYGDIVIQWQAYHCKLFGGGHGGFDFIDWLIHPGGCTEGAIGTVQYESDHGSRTASMSDRRLCWTRLLSHLATTIKLYRGKTERLPCWQMHRSRRTRLRSVGLTPRRKLGAHDCSCASCRSR